MSHFSQMAGLTVQNFVSAATGIAMALAVTRAFARSGAKTVGNFWVDLTRATLYVLLPLSILVALAFVAIGLPQTLDASVDGDDARRRAADDRAWTGRQPGGDQAARHQWRRLLQRQRRASVREPDGAVQLSQHHRHARRVGGARLRLRPDGRRPSPGLGASRRDRHPARRRRRRDLLGGSARQSDPDRTRRRSGARQYGRQGSTLRPGDDAPLYAAVTTGLSDGGVNAMHGSFTRSWRPCADVPDPARRSAAGRRRLRPLRHGRVRHPGRLRRRPDGRPHAGTARQEDRKPRDEIRHAGGAHPAAGHPRLHRRLGDAALGGRERSARAVRMASRRSSMPTRRPPATTARPSAA